VSALAHHRDTAGERSPAEGSAGEPASDKNRQSPIVYEIYQAASGDGENFSKPTYTTGLGVTSFDTPPLPTEKTFYLSETLLMLTER
jgi:hypothetical protein